jgi:ABC-type Na+ efflux pump permease subunit
MVLGKLLAVALAGLLQMLAWACATAGGCALGAALVKAYNPATGMPLLKFFGMLGEASGMFSPINTALALAVVVFGFLMYCSISAIGGALASKQEDLGATNALFTLILLASFFIAVYGGGFSGGEVAPDKWLAYVPFTAVLVTPARLLMGELPPVQGLVSLALIFVLMLLAAIFAGKV